MEQPQKKRRITRSSKNHKPTSSKSGGGHHNKRHSRSNNNGPRGAGRSSHGSGNTITMGSKQYHQAIQTRDKLVAQAKSTLMSGDRVSAEYLFQHAEHYSRIVLAAQDLAEKQQQAKKAQQKQQQEKDESADEQSETSSEEPEGSSDSKDEPVQSTTQETPVLEVVSDEAPVASDATPISDESNYSENLAATEA